MPREPLRRRRAAQVARGDGGALRLRKRGLSERRAAARVPQRPRVTEQRRAAERSEAGGEGRGSAAGRGWRGAKP